MLLTSGVDRRTFTQQRCSVVWAMNLWVKLESRNGSGYLKVDVLPVNVTLVVASFESAGNRKRLRHSKNYEETKRFIWCKSPRTIRKQSETTQKCSKRSSRAQHCSAPSAPYSPDLAPYDFWLFSILKHPIKKIFRDVEEIK